MAAEFIFNQTGEIQKDIRIIKCLVQQNDPEKCEKAIKICKDLLSSGDSDTEKQIEILIWLAK